MGITGYGGEKRKRRGRQKKKTKREEEKDSGREPSLREGSKFWLQATTGWGRGRLLY